MAEPTKRELREQKREVKRAGGKRRRRLLKLSIVENPEEAHRAEANLGRYRSADLNGIDRDSTRLKRGSTEENDTED